MEKYGAAWVPPTWPLRAICRSTAPCSRRGKQQLVRSLRSELSQRLRDMLEWKCYLSTCGADGAYLSVQTLTPESARKCERDGALAIRSYSTHGTLCDAAQSNPVRAWSMRYQTNFAWHRRACRASSTSELRARHLSHIFARIRGLGFARKGRACRAPKCLFGVS